MRRLSFALVPLLLLAGCPGSGSQTGTPPATVDAPPPAAPAPPPPPPRPKEGWAAVSVGSSFETLTKVHFENGALPDSERTTVQTVLGFDAEGVRVRVVNSAGGVAEETESKYAWKAVETDPEAKKPETPKETLTVAGKSWDCEVTTETSGDTTTKTWRTKALPVPVKIEVRGGGLQSTSELVKVDAK